MHGQQRGDSTKRISMISRKRNEEPMEIMLRNKIIPFKENAHFLDSRLNWEEHIKSQSKKSIRHYKSVSRKEKGRRSENPKNCTV